MRANDKQEEQLSAVNYEQQNKILKQLFLQRMKARKQQGKQQKCMEQNQMMVPSMKNVQKIHEMSQIKMEQETQKCKQKIENSLLLNTLFFDNRQIKPHYFIKIFSLLNQDVTKPHRLVSENIESVFITTYGFQVDTFQQMLLTSQLKLVVLNDSDQKENKVIKQYGGFKNFTVVLKSKSNARKYGVFHTKLWLIKFKTFLRVVICTSNQHTMDWAVWQNAFWYQDFQLKSKNQQQNAQKNNQQQNLKKDSFNFNQDFQDTLSQVLDQMLPKKQLQQLTGIKISNYLFNNIKVVLIPSIPGTHQGQSIKKQGIGKMKEVMKIFNKIKDPTITYNSTSLGVLQRKFVQQLNSSFCPNNQKVELEKFRLVYPTKKYIQQQTGGQASVLFLTSQNYKKSDAKSILHRFSINPENPIRGCIPHLKTVLIEGNQKDNQKSILYVGSHNMTKAAWGKYEKNKSQLYIGNSELGLLFFNIDIKWFKKWCPFSYPPVHYSQNDVPFLRDF